jgi:hypothetical protein
LSWMAHWKVCLWERWVKWALQLWTGHNIIPNGTLPYSNMNTSVSTAYPPWNTAVFDSDYHN